jgi:hypothetical protein
LPTAIDIDRRPLTTDLPTLPAGDDKPVVIMAGYPAFDAPILAYALRRQNVVVEELERTWLPVDDYQKHGAVVITGDLARAKIVPSTYAVEDLAKVEQYLQQGGTLLLTRGTIAIFNTPEGKSFLYRIVGSVPIPKGVTPAYEVLDPQHPWLRHLDLQQPLFLESVKNEVPFRTNQAERVIGSSGGSNVLARLPVGKGQIVYIGWEVAASQPNGREPSTAERERIFEQQVQILLNVAADICSR